MAYSITIEELDNGSSADVDRVAREYRTQIGLVGQALMQQNRSMSDFVAMQSIDAKKYQTINKNIKELHEKRQSRETLTYGSMVMALRKTDQRVRVTNALERIVDPLGDRIELIQLDNHERNLTMHRQSMFVLERIRRNTEHNAGLMQTMVVRAHRFYTNMTERPFETLLSGILNTTAKLTTTIGRMAFTAVKNTLFGWRKEAKGFDKVVLSVDKLREYIATGQVDNRKTKWQNFASGGVTGIIGRMAANAVGVNVKKAQEAQQRKELGFDVKEDLSTKLSSMLFGGETLKRGGVGGLFGKQMSIERKKFVEMNLDGLNGLTSTLQKRNLPGKKQQTESFFKKDPLKYQALTLSAVQSGNKQSNIAWISEKRKWTFEKRHIERRDSTLTKIHHELKSSNKRLGHMSTLMSMSALRSLFSAIAAFPAFRILKKLGGGILDKILPKRVKNKTPAKLLDTFKKWVKPQLEHPIKSFKAKSLVGKAIPIVGSLATAIYEYFNAGQNKNANAGTAAKTMVASGTFIGHVAGGILGAFFGPVGAIAGGLIGGEIGKFLGEAAADVFTGSKFLGNFGQATRDYYDDVKNWFVGSYNGAIRYMKQKLSSAKDWAMTKINAVGSWFGGVQDKIRTGVINISTQVSDAYNSAVSYVVDKFNSAVDIKNQIKTYVTNLYERVVETVSSFVRRTIDGVTSGIFSLFDDEDVKNKSNVRSSDSRINQRNRQSSWTDAIRMAPETGTNKQYGSVDSNRVYERAVEDININNEQKQITKEDLMNVGSVTIDYQQLELLQKIYEALTGVKRSAPVEQGPQIFRPDFMNNDMARGGSW